MPDKLTANYANSIQLWGVFDVRDVNASSVRDDKDVRLVGSACLVLDLGNPLGGKGLASC